MEPKRGHGMDDPSWYVLVTQNEMCKLSHSAQDQTSNFPVFEMLYLDAFLAVVCANLVFAILDLPIF